MAAVFRYYASNAKAAKRIKSPKLSPVRQSRSKNNKKALSLSNPWQYTKDLSPTTHASPGRSWKRCSARYFEKQSTNKKLHVNEKGSLHLEPKSGRQTQKKQCSRLIQQGTSNTQAKNIKESVKHFSKQTSDLHSNRPGKKPQPKKQAKEKPGKGTTTKPTKKKSIVKESLIQTGDFYKNRLEAKGRVKNKEEPEKKERLQEKLNSIEESRIIIAHNKKIDSKTKQNKGINKKLTKHNIKIIEQAKKQSLDIFEEKLLNKDEKPTQTPIDENPHKLLLDKSKVLNVKLQNKLILGTGPKPSPQNQLAETLQKRLAQLQKTEKTKHTVFRESAKIQKQEKKNLTCEKTDPSEHEDEINSIIDNFRQNRKSFLNKLRTEQKKNDNSFKKALDYMRIPKKNEPNEANIIKKFMISEQGESSSNEDINALITPNNGKNKCDDEEGFLRVNVGDTINKYFILSILGKGVYSNVVCARNELNKTQVAIKIIRNNKLMFRTSIREILFLKKISEARTDTDTYCVKYYAHFLHQNHLCIVLEALSMDLRKFLRKNGKCGLDMKSVSIYSKQLFIALNVLKKLGIIHADIKPDNILVDDTKNLVKLCDFGSATQYSKNEAIAYLVSRYYRAPEVILGIPYTHAIDIWATACTIYEMSTGKILFVGKTNNKMLKCFIELKGKFPARVIRQGKFKNQHFNFKNQFVLRYKGESGKEKQTITLVNDVPTRELFHELKYFSKYRLANNDSQIKQLKDLLDRMLNLDPNLRLSAKDCLLHEFVKDS